MYEGSSSLPIRSEEHFDTPVGEAAQPSEEPKDSDCKSTGNDGNMSDSSKSRVTSQFRSTLEERLSRHGGPSRRLRPPKPELADPDKGSLTPAMRKKYLKELFLSNRSGLSSILSSKHNSSKEEEDEAAYGDTVSDAAIWALDPMEHAWMLSVVDGQFDTMVEFLAEDPSLLSRKDFISGFTALHWLAKNGKDETLIKLLRHAEKAGLSVNVNLRGSGGVTPLHVAAMHNQYMVVKILVGAFNAKTDVMDYNGKRAWQYLKDKAPREMKELLGAWDDEHNIGHLNLNNSASQAQPAEEHNWDNKVEVDGSWGITRQRFASFKRLLFSIGLIEKI